MDEVQFILDLLEKNGNEMPFKELNDIFGEKFEGARLVLKKMKAEGLVDFPGVLPGFSDTIKFVSPKDRVREEGFTPSWQMVEKPSDLSEEDTYALDLLEKNGGEMGYKEMNAAFGEKYEGLRLILRKLKAGGFVDFEGAVMPGFNDRILLLRNA